MPENNIQQVIGIGDGVKCVDYCLLFSLEKDIILSIFILTGR